MSRFLASVCTALFALTSFSMAFTSAPVFASDNYYADGCTGSCEGLSDCLSKGKKCPPKTPNCTCNKAVPTCECT